MNQPPDRGKPPITFDRSKSMAIITPGPKYLIMSRVNNDKTENSEISEVPKKTLSEVSPFLIKKVIDGTCGGEVESCKKLLNGTILIKTKNFSQARNLIQLTSLSPEIKVELNEHQTLNYAKGVVYSNDLRGISEEEILSELKSQNVCKVNKILKKVDNNLKETGLIVVTFASTSLPSELSIGYEKIKIRPHIPLPLKCKTCLRFGHLAKFCNNKRICFNCSNEYHVNDDNNETCSNSQSCINCKENNKIDNNHSPNDKSCPIFLKEKEIQAIITLEKTNRKTATTKYNERHPTTSNTYSSTVKSTSTTSNSTATTPDNKPTNNTNSSHVNKEQTMPPPTKTTSRELNDYLDVLSEASDIDSTSSQNTTDSKTKQILPRNTSKRTRKQLQKLQVESKTKRTKNV